MNAGATFERVYAALKQQLREGRFAPGERLEPAALSEDQNSSVTPIRDALHRLVGERLVDAPRHNGFRAYALSEMAARHLYSWNADLLLLAVRSPGLRLPRIPDTSISDETSSEEVVAATEALFFEVVRSSGNPEHALAIASAGDRLYPLRLIEAEVLSDVASEVRELIASLQSGETARLRRIITAYHKRRLRAAPYLVEALQSRAPRQGDASA